MSMCQAAGISLINDCKYGQVRTAINLNLLRSPVSGSRSGQSSQEFVCIRLGGAFDSKLEYAYAINNPVIYSDYAVIIDKLSTFG